MPACRFALATAILATAALLSCGFAAVAQETGHPAGPPVAPAAPVAPARSEAPGVWEQDSLTGDWGGLRTTLLDSGVTFSLTEQSEVWGNLTGGLRRGVVYDGLTTASVTLDLDKLAGWRGATFFVSAYQIHGGGPTANLVGSLQPISGLEATRDTKLYALWLEQTLMDGRLTIRIGQEGANDQMMISRYGALFLNSSFGFPPLAAVDLPSGAPNFPLATPFVRGQFKATDEVMLSAAVFNGDPAPNGTGDPQLRDRGGDAFRLNAHAFAVTELWYSVNQGDGATGLPGTYKLGAWYHSGHFADQLLDTSGRSLADPASTGVPLGHSTGFAGYAMFDQMIWQQGGEKGRGIGVFGQVMAAPSAFNLSNLFLAAGVNWTGPFGSRPSDSFGVAVSYLGISPRKRRLGSDVVAFTGSGSPYAANETVLEATYLVQVTPWWTLQPDLQVVINPGAGIPSGFSAAPLKNDVIAGVRSGIVF